MKTKLLFSLFCMLSVFLSACGSVSGLFATATPTFTPTATVTPTHTPTLTSVPSPTHTPTFTPIPATSSSCKIISVVQVSSGSEIPAFEYKAEGFAPDENVYVTLEGGTTKIGGITATLTTGEFTAADIDGKISGSIVVSLFSSEPVEYPDNFGFTVEGSGNDCEASQDVPWSP